MLPTTAYRENITLLLRFLFSISFYTQIHIQVELSFDPVMGQLGTLDSSTFSTAVNKYIQ